MIALEFQESSALKFKQWYFLLVKVLVKASHKASITLQYIYDASHLELAGIPQVKGTVPNKTAPNLDTSCSLGVPRLFIFVTY